jgi:hypothetical protein
MAKVRSAARAPHLRTDPIPCERSAISSTASDSFGSKKDAQPSSFAHAHFSSRTTRHDHGRSPSAARTNVPAGSGRSRLAIAATTAGRAGSPWAISLGRCPTATFRRRRYSVRRQQYHHRPRRRPPSATQQAA